MKKAKFKIISCIFALMCTTASAQKQGTLYPAPEPENIYKHYTGTIGDKKIVLDLMYGYNGGSNFGGSRYYTPGKEGVTTFSMNGPSMADRHAMAVATEFTPIDQLWVKYSEIWPNGTTPHWQFHIVGNRLNGTWTSADSTQRYDVHLTEDYSQSSKMDISFIHDTILIINKYGRKFIAQLNLVTAWPLIKEDNGQFIMEEISLFLTGAKGLNKDDYLRGLKEDYRQKLIGGNRDRIDYNSEEGEEVYAGWGWYCMYMELTPEYNDNGFLVLKKAYGDMCTYKIVKNERSFLCLDVRNKKRLEYNDILTTDSTKISELLGETARKQYQLDADKKLSTWFLYDHLPVTKNIALGNEGITFLYREGEILEDKKDGKGYSQIPELFISYKDLGDMLTKNFKKRIGM